MNSYTASAIEVLAGLEPVRTRPGMFTQTERPNHLVQEVVDNSVDEVIAGFATRIDVVLHAEGSVEVSDNGRGMPVDLHPGEGIPGVEVILTRLHAGGKFTAGTYQFSGGLHGVGVSVVNALSRRLEVTVRRSGKVYTMAFENGARVSALRVAGKTAKKDTGTLLRFWPDAGFFDSPNISVPRLKRLLRAKAVLSPGLVLEFTDQVQPENSERWCFGSDLGVYLTSRLGGAEAVPAVPFTREFKDTDAQLNCSCVWMSGDGDPVAESFVNLVPTSQGGTHVNGLRSGLTEALREYCEYRSLLPRGIRLAPDDVVGRLCYVLSVRLRDPQFTGQTKDRLSSRATASWVSGVVRDAFSLWLNQHVTDADAIAELAIGSAQRRQKAARKTVRKKITSGPALPGKLADCSSQDIDNTELFLVEGDSAGGSAKQARSREFQAIMPLRGKILNTWEVDSTQILASQEVHDIAVALGVDPGSNKLEGLRYGRVCILADADSDGAHIATLLCALFVRHFPALVEAGRICVAMPPLFRIDVGKQVFYALDEAEKTRILQRLEDEKVRGKVNVQRFKGLGEMNPLQLRETTMAPATRRLVQLQMTAGDGTVQMLNTLLGKKQITERKRWLAENGDQAELD